MERNREGERRMKRERKLNIWRETERERRREAIKKNRDVENTQKNWQ